MAVLLTIKIPLRWTQIVILALGCGALTAASGLRADTLQWAPAVNGVDVRWADADAHCRNLRAGDHADWRLPTLAELETLLASGASTMLAGDACCLWSATSLAQMPTDAGGAPGARPDQYYWGLLVDGAVRYYSLRHFTDGQALCVREAG